MLGEREPWDRVQESDAKTQPPRPVADILGVTENETPSINAKTAKGLGMAIRGLVEAGVYDFASFVRTAIDELGIDNVRYLSKHLQAGWDRIRERDGRLEPSRPVADILKERSKMDDEDELKPTDMTPLAYLVIETWRQTRPKAVRQLEASGKLEEIAALTAYEIATLHETLWKQGMPAPAAIQEAESQFLHVPDIS